MDCKVDLAHHELFIGGKYVAPTSGEYSIDLNPATEEPIAEVAQARRGRRRPGGRRGASGAQGLERDARGRPRPHLAARGVAPRGASGRAHRAGKPGCRQAAGGGAAAGYGGGHRHRALLRRLVRQDHRTGDTGAPGCLDVHRARTGGRGRGHRAVEFSADDRHVENRTGARLRLHTGGQARGADAAFHAAGRRAVPRSGIAAGRAQRGVRQGQRGRRGTGAPSRRRQGDLHGLAAGRPRNTAGRRRQFQKGHSRTRR